MVKGYFSYLLRLWQADGGQKDAWYASLERIPKGERVVFPNLRALLDYLHEQVSANAAQTESDMSDTWGPGNANGERR